MYDMISQLQVITRESGCLIDITTLLDRTVCPKIDLIAKKPRKVTEKGDYITITPTTPTKPTKPVKPVKPVTPYGTTHYRRGCSNKGCYEVPEQVCKKNTVAHDLQTLLLLGLLSKEDLEKYLQTTGDLDEDETLDEDEEEVGVDPLLGLDVGENGSIADLDVGGEKGLLDLVLGGGNGKTPLANLNLLGPDGLLRLDLNGKPLLQLRRRGDRLADVDVGGPADAPEDQAQIDVDVLTTPIRRSQRLADVDVGGPADAPEDQAQIDVDVLTHSRRADRLLDIDIGGEADAPEDKAAIDVDLLTTPPKKNGGEGNGSNGSGSGSNGSGSNGSGSGSGSNGSGSGSNYGKGGKKTHDLTKHYQPLCNKGFKKEHVDRTRTEYANDVNHCLAICQAKGAILTLDADVKVGDVARILVCVAIEFDQKASNGNCKYMVAPETEPCEEEYLEEKDDCYTFVRN